MGLTQLKPGDKVFVVWQRSRYELREGTAPRTATMAVERVGRLYGYIKENGFESPFSLETGLSHHKEWNDRANGQGFDVYDSRSQYERELHARERRKLLKTRLVRHGDLIELPDDAVEAIHAILDQLKTD